MLRWNNIVYIAIAGLWACNTLIMPQIPEKTENVSLVVTPYLFEENETRTTIAATDAGLSFKWSNGDPIGVFSSYGDYSGNQVKFVSKTEDDASTASFDGAGWTFNPLYTYVAYYPYDALNNNHTAIPVHFRPLTQEENGATSHLSANDFIYATNQVAEDKITFLFKHLGCAVRIQLVIPVATSVSSLRLQCASAKFPTSGTVNISSGLFTPEESSKTASVNLSLADIEVGPSNDYLLTAWLMMAPVELSSEKLELVATDTYGNEYKTSIQGKSFQSGKAYRIKATAEEVYTFIDLGLPSGTRWANMNLGADTHYGHGGYYSWASVNPTSGNYLQQYWDYHGPSYTFVSQNDDRSRSQNEAVCGYTLKYINDDEPNISGVSEYDAAFGAGKGVLPTYAQCAELGANCTHTDLPNIGVLLTSKINGNSIIIPYAGYYTCGNKTLVGKRFYFWTSQITRPGSGTDSGNACVTQGETNNASHTNYLYLSGSRWPRFYGMSIRPVTNP